jgi:hypothetical protein
MAALFDLHALVALQNGWTRFSGLHAPPPDGPIYGLANFKRHFPMVEDDVVESWFKELVEDSKVTFRSFASPGHDDFPLVVLQLASESSSVDILGNAARVWEDGAPSQYVDAMVVKQELNITIFTKAHEITRALFVVCRAILLRYVPMFLEAGYLDIKYLDAAELGPEEALIAEDLGVFVRRMRWTASSQVEAFPIEDGVVIPAKPWWVLASDISTSTNPNPPPDRTLDSVDGIPGGVVAYKEE